MAEQKRGGCLKGIVVATIVAVLIVAVVMGWISRQMGGIAGFEREVFLKGALNGVEQQVLAQRPDGVSEAEIRGTFDRARAAVSENKVNLTRMRDVLDEYIRAYKKHDKRPSDAEVRAFLTDLEGSLTTDSSPQS